MEQKTIIKELMFQYCSQGKLKRFHELFTTTNETVSKVKINCMKNTKGQTLLYVSCLNGHYKMSIYLITNGADPNQRCADGSTPTHAAARSCCSNLLKYVVEVGGGDLRLHDVNSLTPIDWLLALDKNRIKKSLQVLQKWQHSVSCTLSNQEMLNDKTAIFFPNFGDISIKSKGFGNYIMSKQGTEQISTMSLCSSVSIASSADMTINYKCSWAYKTPPMFEMRTALWKGQDITAKCRKYGEVCNEDLLLNELKACSQLRHPNILLLMAVCHQSIFERLSYKACNILIFERVEYGSLFHLLHSGPLPHHDFTITRDLTLKYMLQISHAITFLHEQNLVHSAISSHAVNIVSRDLAKLGDFICIGHVDSAKYLNDDILSHLSRWLCPASFQTEYFSTNFDVYSFCIVIIECFTKKIPWSDMSSTSVARNMKQNQMEFAIPSEIPYDLRSTLYKGINAHKNNKYMFRTADIGFAIQQLLNESSSSAVISPKVTEPSQKICKGIDVPDCEAFTQPIATNRAHEQSELQSGDVSSLVTAHENTTPANVASENFPFNKKITEQNKHNSPTQTLESKCMKKTEMYFPTNSKQLYGMSRSSSLPARKDDIRKLVKLKPKISLVDLKTESSPLCTQVQRVQSLLSEMSTIFSQQLGSDREENCTRFMAVSPPSTQFVPEEEDAVVETIDVIDGIKTTQIHNSTTTNDKQFLTVNETFSDKNTGSERRYSIDSQDLEGIFEEFATRENSSSKKSSFSETFQSGKMDVSSSEQPPSKASFEVHYTCLRISDPIIRNPKKLQITANQNSSTNKNVCEIKENSVPIAQKVEIPKVAITEVSDPKPECAHNSRTNEPTNVENKKEANVNDTTPANGFVTCIDDSKVIEEGQVMQCEKTNASSQTNVSFSKGEMHTEQPTHNHKQFANFNEKANVRNKVQSKSPTSDLKNYQRQKAMYPQTPSKWPFQKKLQLFKTLGTNNKNKPAHALDFNAAVENNSPIQNGNLKSIATQDTADPVTPVMPRAISLIQDKGVKTSTPVPRCNALLQKQMDSRIALSELQRKMEFTLSTVQNDTTCSEHQTKPDDKTNFKVQFDENECIPRVKILPQNVKENEVKTNEECEGSIEGSKAWVSRETLPESNGSSYNSENDRQEDFTEDWSVYHNTCDTNGSLLDALVDNLAESITNSIIKDEVAALAPTVI